MNYFKILHNLKPLIQSGKLTRIDEALSYLQSAGMKIDGILRKGVENIFKSIKARDPDFNTTVTKMSIDEEGIPFNPNTLKSTPEKRGVENLFEETKRVNMPAEKLNHQMIADQAGIDVELIKGKDWVEILEVLKGLGKADGGRIGYDIGGLTGQAKNIYDSWIAAGHPEADVLAYLQSRGLYNPQDVGITSIVNTQQPIIPQGDGGGDGGRGIINIDRGLKTADDYGSGVYGNNFNDPDVQAEIDALNPGGLKGLIQNLMDLPTPMNLVRKGINKFQDWRTQQNQLAIDAQKKAAAAKIAQEKIAAAEAAINRQASGAPAYNPTGEGNQTPGIGWNEKGGPVSNRSGRGRTDWADGGQVGLATMFTRRR